MPTVVAETLEQMRGSLPAGVCAQALPGTSPVEQQ